MSAALLVLKRNLFNLVSAVIALIALLGLSGAWGHDDFITALRSAAAAQSCLDTEEETPGSFARLEPTRIRYSQSTYSLYGITDEGGFYTLEDNIQWLKDHPDQDLPWGGPIRVFRKQPFMDDWGPLSHEGFTGDPKNLQNGKIYTLDHRRLVAYRLAGRKTIPVQWASLNVVRDNRWKFTTPNGGRSITPKPEVLELLRFNGWLGSVRDSPRAQDVDDDKSRFCFETVA